jgi:hypothetical protein
MFCHKKVADWDQSSSNALGIGENKLRFIQLKQSTPIINVSAGLFRQKGIFETYNADHPLNLSWEIYKNWVESNQIDE